VGTEPISRAKEEVVGDQDFKKLSREELEELAGEPLPERAAMSLINANVAAPVNLAAALNVLSDNSVAVAQATQTAPITQST
jgi:hypothetical protein